MTCLFVALGSATGQQAPEGNAHPRAAAVSEFGGSNPFGEATASAFDIAEKREFAAAVDLGPLRDLALFHGGRVKILDTLARETVSAVTGRKSYFDLEPESEGDATGPVAARKVKYDPLFTFVDMIADPMYYADKPLIAVEYLPLREALLAAAGADDRQREWWKKQGRLSPLMVSRYGPQVAQEHSFDQPYRAAIDRVSGAMGLYGFGWRNLAMVAPRTAEGDWGHVSALPPDSAAAKTIAELGTAWRAGDAAKVNEAVRALAAELPRINAEHYPTTRREVERLYNAANPFEYGFWIYFLSLVMLLLAFGTGRRWLVWSGVAALAGAIGLHLSGFTARCYIAERLAIQNQFESMTGLSLGAAIVGAVAMVLRRQWLFGAAAAGVGFMVLITATQTGIPGHTIEREAPILNTSVLLKYHVTTVLVSYGLISLGFIISLFYLGTYYAGKMRGTVAPAVEGEGGGFVEVSATALGLDEDAPKGPQRVLSDLDKAQMIILQLAFWGLGVGILLGAWWADHSWGRWWAFDPKELWALITWIVYLVVVHVRVTSGRNRALLTAWLSVLGFIVMLWTYFGVNLLLPGLHAYA